MALPASINPNSPLDTDLASTLGSQVRNLKQFIVDTFGLTPFPSTQNAAATSIGPAGIVTLAQSGARVIANPTVPLGIVPKQYVDVIGPWSGTATGTNSYNVNVANPNGEGLGLLPTPLVSLIGVPMIVTFQHANTGTSTLLPNSLSANPIYFGGAPLTGGEIIPNVPYVLLFDGTVYNLQTSAAAGATGVGAPTATTVLLNTNIGAGPTAIMHVTSTPPATPSASTKFRALVSFSVFFISSSSSNSNLAVAIADSATLFTANVEGVQGRSVSNADYQGISGTFISTASATNAGGAVTFTLNGFAQNNNANIQALSDNSVTATRLAVAWLPAI